MISLKHNNKTTENLKHSCKENFSSSFLLVKSEQNFLIKSKSIKIKILKLSNFFI